MKQFNALAKLFPLVVCVVGVIAIVGEFNGRLEWTQWFNSGASLRFATAICFIAAAYIAVRTRARSVGTPLQQMLLGTAINTIVGLLILSVVSQLWETGNISLGSHFNLGSMVIFSLLAFKGLLIVNGNNVVPVRLIAYTTLAAAAMSFIGACYGADFCNNQHTGICYASIISFALLALSDLTVVGFGFNLSKTLKEAANWRTWKENA